MKNLSIKNADKLAKFVFDLAVSQDQTPAEAQALCEYFWLVARGCEEEAKQEFGSVSTY